MGFEVESIYVRDQVASVVESQLVSVMKRRGRSFIPSARLIDRHPMSTDDFERRLSRYFAIAEYEEPRLCLLQEAGDSAEWTLAEALSVLLPKSDVVFFALHEGGGGWGFLRYRAGTCVDGGAYPPGGFGDSFPRESGLEEWDGDPTEEAYSFAEKEGIQEPFVRYGCLATSGFTHHAARVTFAKFMKESEPVA